jgi:FtsP/CotA-like multicopper oxidase with cupredoxin domain
VPQVTQPLIPPGGQYHYHFKLLQSGTYWMHSHHGLQIQEYLSAPFIISDPDEKQDVKEIIMFLADYNQKSPQTIMHELHSMGSMANMSSSKPDLNDVTYDAYLTNYRTLKNPEIVTVTPGETVRLRVIDGSAATNFFVNIGQLSGQAIAVDGESITDMAHPMHLHGHVFEVTKINGQPIKDGAMHDTVLVLPHTSLSVQFDSDNIGNWMLHCHMLYHQESGMMSMTHYAGFEKPAI